MASLVVAPATYGAPINYNNFNAPPVVFTQVTEDSATDPVPIFGPPSPFLVGLDFNPQSFASSSGGGGGDVTSGVLTFGVTGAAVPGSIVSINSLRVDEGGDYSLAGAGTALTKAAANLEIRVTVTHIDGVDTPDVVVPLVSSGVNVNLAANAGVVVPWQLNGAVGIEAYLTSQSIPFLYGATNVLVEIENELSAMSETSTAAAIFKKEFIVTVVPDVDIVPEPATWALGTLALCGLGLSRARRRG